MADMLVYSALKEMANAQGGDSGPVVPWRTGYQTQSIRATYATLNTHNSGTPSVSFFDQDFNTLGYDNTYHDGSSSQYIQLNNNTWQYREQLYASMDSTSSQPSSSGTQNYPNATNVMGEFGNAVTSVFSDGSFIGNYQRGSSWNQKARLNAYAISSDHPNRRIGYIYYSGKLRAIDAYTGRHDYDMAGTENLNLSSELSVHTSMGGAGCYHNGRKELILMSYTSNSGNYNIIQIQGFDLETYPSPKEAFENKTGVVTRSTTIPNWDRNNDESYYGLKPILCDDGTLFITIFFTSDKFSLYEGTLEADPTTFTCTRQMYLNTSTSYGREQSATYYGQRSITSRDGTSVMTFCPYYYYGSGIKAFMIDKSTATYTSYSHDSSSYGIQPMPWRDDGWAFIYCGNGYASNYNGNYVHSMYAKHPSGTGGFVQTSSNKYFPYHHGYNSTNYPGFTFVNDYWGLTYNDPLEFDGTREALLRGTY